MEFFNAELDVTLGDTLTVPLNHMVILLIK
jgi:hypothetical protein